LTTVSAPTEILVIKSRLLSMEKQPPTDRNENEWSEMCVSGIALLGSISLFSAIFLGPEMVPFGYGLLFLSEILRTGMRAIAAISTIETNSVFNEIRKKFAEKGGLYDEEYIKIPEIKNAYENMSSQSMNWWVLSWKAIVPLYTAGFKVYKNGTIGEVDFDMTACWP